MAFENAVTKSEHEVGRKFAKAFLKAVAKIERFEISRSGVASFACRPPVPLAGG
jgi:hypothetical protein